MSEATEEMGLPNTLSNFEVFVWMTICAYIRSLPENRRQDIVELAVQSASFDPPHPMVEEIVDKIKTTFFGSNFKGVGSA